MKLNRERLAAEYVLVVASLPTGSKLPSDSGTQDGRDRDQVPAGPRCTKLLIARTPHSFYHTSTTITRYLQDKYESSARRHEVLEATRSAGAYQHIKRRICDLDEYIVRERIPYCARKSTDVSSPESGGITSYRDLHSFIHLQYNKDHLSTVIKILQSDNDQNAILLLTIDPILQTPSSCTTTARESPPIEWGNVV